MNGPALVTGASGFLGRPLVAALLAAGRPVTALCRRPDDLAGVHGGMAHPLLRVVQADLRQPEGWRPLLEPGISVFHLAAARNGPAVSAREMEEVNVGATVALARRAAEVGAARFVHTATALIYGPSNGRPRTEADGTAGALGAYARSKAAAVDTLRELAREGLPAVVVCPTLVYGPDATGHPNRLTSEMRRLLRTRLELRLGDGRSARNLVHVDDVVRGLLLAEERGEPGEELILGGEDASPRDFSRLVLARAGLRPRAALPVPAVLARAAARAADRLRGYEPGCGYAAAVRTLGLSWRFSSERARRRLGYEPLSLAEGLGRTIHWIRSTQRKETHDADR
jgi:nucleoside-diphosphate-sugar epimerase